MSRTLKWVAFLVDVAYYANAQDVHLMPVVIVKDAVICELIRRAYFRV